MYNRSHFNVNPRFVYGMCVGGQFEKMLKIHKQARKCGTSAMPVHFLTPTTATTYFNE
jgi:hypothetical protein